MLNYKRYIMYDIILDFIDKIKYEVLKSPLPIVARIPSEIDIKIEYDNKNKVFWVESNDLPDFVASAIKEEELPKEIHDTLLLYFDIPRYIAKKLSSVGEIIKPDGTRIIDKGHKTTYQYHYEAV